MLRRGVLGDIRGSRCVFPRESLAVAGNILEECSRGFRGLTSHIRDILRKSCCDTCLCCVERNAKVIDEKNYFDRLHSCNMKNIKTAQLENLC